MSDNNGGLYNLISAHEKRIAEQQARIEALEAKQWWIPVSERMPEDVDEDLLVRIEWIDNGHQDSFYKVMDWLEVCMCYHGIPGKPTHWKHIEPPEQEGE